MMEGLDGWAADDEMRFEEPFGPWQMVGGAVSGGGDDAGGGRVAALPGGVSLAPPRYMRCGCRLTWARQTVCHVRMPNGSF